MKSILTQKVLAPTQISLGDYCINPYRGCEFNCSYCYARKNKNNQSDGEVWAKINAPEILEKELRFAKPKHVLLGSTTECFQQKEENLHITRDILTILNKKNIPYTILTKSHLIKNYLDLIRNHKDNKIYFTLNFHDENIIQALEEKSSPLYKRLKALNAIIGHGINLRIHIGPFIPYLSNLSELIKIIPDGVKEVDIELYQSKMGDFEMIIKKTKTFLGKNIENLKAIYQTHENYLKFTQNLREDIIKLKEKYPYTFYLIVPEYGDFYTPNINYDNTRV
jgi:DNA repair photolyase